MMYLKLNADYEQGELVPLLDDAIYVYCDVCKSLLDQYHLSRVIKLVKYANIYLGG